MAKKVTVEVTDQLDQVLSKLAENQAVTKSQVVRRALALLDYLNDEQSNGRRVVTEGQNGEDEREIVFH